MARTKKQHSQAKGKKPINSKGKQCDIRDEYDAVFPIFSEDEGKRFCSLVKKKI